MIDIKKFEKEIESLLLKNWLKSSLLKDIIKTRREEKLYYLTEDDIYKIKKEIKKTIKQIVESVPYQEKPDWVGWQPVNSGYRNGLVEGWYEYYKEIKHWKEKILKQLEVDEE